MSGSFNRKGRVASSTSPWPGFRCCDQLRVCPRVEFGGQARFPSKAHPCEHALGQWRAPPRVATAAAASSRKCRLAAGPFTILPRLRQFAAEAPNSRPVAHLAQSPFLRPLGWPPGGTYDGIRSRTPRRLVHVGTKRLLHPRCLRCSALS